VIKESGPMLNNERDGVDATNHIHIPMNLFRLVEK